MHIIEKPFALPGDTVAPEMPPSPKLPYIALRALMRSKLAKLRADMAGLERFANNPPQHDREQRLPGYKGDISVRVYLPRQSDRTARPLLVYFHGGGWFGGTVIAVDAYCRAVCDRADAVVVSVDYALCPEHPFPHGLEDCYAAARWAASNAELGIDPQRVFVGGDSAGGNLAAAVALAARERGDLTLAGQMLLYPCVTMVADPAPAGAADTFMRVIADWYCGGGKKAEQPLVSPLLAPSLAGLPAALVAVCEYDGLKAQGIAYAERLEAAGVPTRCLLYLGTSHAFIDSTGSLPAADDMVDEAAAFINEMTAAT